MNGKKIVTTKDPSIIWWRIYYGDESTFTSNSGSWSSAPDTNVQIVLLWRKDLNTRILHGRDFYWYDPKASLYTFGQTNKLTEVKNQIKYGAWVDDWTFQKILWNALLDERELYYPGVYPRIPPPSYLLIDRGGN